MTVEEFIHNPDGTLVNKDPWAPFLIKDTRVKMINSKLARRVHCDIKDGELGRTTPTTVTDTQYSKEYNEDKIFIEWDSGNYYHCARECLEVIS